MAIDRADFDAIVEADLTDLIDVSVPEGLRIEYKREPYGRTDDDKKEFLKDISSLANTTGGHLLIGVIDTAGFASGLAGFPDTELDELKQRLKSLARDALEPRIVGFRMQAVRLSAGGMALAIRVPQS